MIDKSISVAETLLEDISLPENKEIEKIVMKNVERIMNLSD